MNYTVVDCCFNIYMFIVDIKVNADIDTYYFVTQLIGFFYI